MDIATIIAAILAAITGGISVIVSTRNAKRDNLKRDMLENLTAERIDDLHNIKKYANILLSNATIIIMCKDDLNTTEIIKSIIVARNELWFILKPVYKFDAEVLISLTSFTNIMLSYLKDKKTTDVETIKKLRDEFREAVFLYVHSSWTCIKNQILKGEQSGYNEFENVFEKNIGAIKKVRKEEKNAEQLWHI